MSAITLDMSMTPVDAYFSALPTPEEYERLLAHLYRIQCKTGHTALNASRVQGSLSHRIGFAPRVIGTWLANNDASAFSHYVGSNNVRVPTTPEHVEVVNDLIRKSGYQNPQSYAHLVDGYDPRYQVWQSPHGFDVEDPVNFFQYMAQAGYATPGGIAQFETHLEAKRLDAEWLPIHRLTLWQLRELARLAHNIKLPDSIAKRIPLETLLKEIPHLAIKGANKGKVAFTEDPKRGARDVQSVMKPGKYLRRSLSENVSDQQLKELVSDLFSATSMPVHLAATAEEFRDVYLKGPDSCMSHDEYRFDRTIDTDGDWRHPVEAYAHPDSHIRLAWVESQGRPAARCLINTRTKRWAAIYASDWCPPARRILKDWLEVEGYAQRESALCGEPMSLVRLANGAFLCPYIDCNSRGVELYEDGDCLIIGGNFHAPHNKGYFFKDGREQNDDDSEEEDTRDRCNTCDEHTDDDELVCTNDGATCDGCLNDYYCEAFSNGTDYAEWVRTEETIELGMTASSERDTALAVTNDFDEWHRLDVVPDATDHGDSFIKRADAMEMADEDGMGIDEFVPDDRVWRDPGATPEEVYDFIEHEGYAVDSDHVWFNYTRRTWVLTADHDPDEDNMIQVDRYGYRERDAADDVLALRA